MYELKKLNLNIEEGEFITLLGPSGCGKSTLLRCIAGLNSIDRGEIFIDEKDMTNVIPKDRNIGMVFQNYALFPNMTVWENIEFGLKMKKEKNYDEKIKNIINKLYKVRENKWQIELY